MLRAKQIARGKSDEEQERRRNGSSEPLTEEELKKFALAEQTEEELQKILRRIQEMTEDPEVNAEQKKELEERARMVAAMLQQARRGQLDQRKWQELVESDQMKAVLEAIARGEPIPDEQWNKVMSKLDKGLWQVRGQAPPEDYRKAIEQFQEQIRRRLSAETANAK